eukprot:jgi/Psemu1/42439/gm1.42439_g
MIADFFTKPLQGALFYKFRDAVLGIQAKYLDEYNKAKYNEALEKYRQLQEQDHAKSNLTNDQASEKLQECAGHTNDKCWTDGSLGNANGQQAGQGRPVQGEESGKINCRITEDWQDDKVLLTLEQSCFRTDLPSFISHGPMYCIQLRMLEQFFTESKYAKSERRIAQMIEAIVGHRVVESGFLRRTLNEWRYVNGSNCIRRMQT